MNPNNRKTGLELIGLEWLLQLRWWAVGAQLVAIVVAVLQFNLKLPLLPLGVVISSCCGIQRATWLLASGIGGN